MIKQNKTNCVRSSGVAKGMGGGGQWATPLLIRE